jgi:hypothetical protein
MRQVVLGAVLLLTMFSCGGIGVPVSEDICNCTPVDPFDPRHDAKHVPLPSQTPQEITVATILGWPQTPDATIDQARSGRELQLFHIPHAFLRAANLFVGDCDITMEISDTGDANAPRAIVETPVDSEYCSARQNLKMQLAAHGFMLSVNSGELPTPLTVDVVGLAFQDVPHAGRGSALVQTVWELHPAVVNVTQ